MKPCYSRGISETLTAEPSAGYPHLDALNVEKDMHPTAKCYNPPHRRHKTAKYLGHFPTDFLRPRVIRSSLQTTSSSEDSMLQFAVSSQLNVNATTKVRTCDEDRDWA